MFKILHKIFNWCHKNSLTLDLHVSTDKFVGTQNSLGVHAVHLHRISHRMETVTGCRQTCVLCFTLFSPILPSPLVIKSCRPASLWWFLLSVGIQFAICEDPAASCNGPCYCHSKYWFFGVQLCLHTRRPWPFIYFQFIVIVLSFMYCCCYSYIWNHRGSFVIFPKGYRVKVIPHTSV